LIGEILYDIMDKQLKDGTLQYVNTDSDNWENNSHKFNL
jgi:hypothetical protein